MESRGLKSEEERKKGSQRQKREKEEMKLQGIAARFAELFLLEASDGAHIVCDLNILGQNQWIQGRMHVGPHVGRLGESPDILEPGKSLNLIGRCVEVQEAG